MTDPDERQRHEAIIEQACQRAGLAIGDWSINEDEGRVQAHLGRYSPIEGGDIGNMFSTDDEGELVAMVVGAREYNNERVSFWFYEDSGASDEVDPMDLEPLL